MTGVVAAARVELTDDDICRKILRDAYAQKLRSDIVRGSTRGEGIRSIPLPRLAQVRMWDWFIQTDPATAKSLSKDLGMGYDEIIVAAQEARGHREGKAEEQLEEAERELLSAEREAAVELVESVGVLALRMLERSTFTYCFWPCLMRWDWAPPPGRIRSSVKDDVSAVVAQVSREEIPKKLLVNYAKTRYFLTQ